MSIFLKGCACEGRRPRTFANRSCYPRPSLIARLLYDRQVSRFVVAPDGFGKSSLAFLYAQTVFNFEHVFWVNAQSPCFLRDLDLGILAQDVLLSDKQAALVVFDALPALSSERASMFSAQIDAFLKSNCEVIVTCVPSHDCFADLQKDRLSLSAGDLLLSEEELKDSLKDEHSEEVEDINELLQSPQIPALFWGNLKPSAFLTGIAGESLPGELLCALLVLLVLRKGSLEELEAFGNIGSDMLSLLASKYPFSGIDESFSAFHATSFTPDEIARAFLVKWELATRYSLFSTGAEFSLALADALLNRREAQRACEVVGALCPKDKRPAWIKRQSGSLFRQACLLPLSDITAGLGVRLRRRFPCIEADEAWRAICLGDVVYARRLVYALLDTKDQNAQIKALLLLARYGNKADKDSAGSRLDKLYSSFTYFGCEVFAHQEDPPTWMSYLIGLYKLAQLKPEEACRRWDKVSACKVDDALSVAALWLYLDTMGLHTERALSTNLESAHVEAGAKGTRELSDTPSDLQSLPLDEGLLKRTAQHLASCVQSPNWQDDALCAWACAAWLGLRKRGMAQFCTQIFPDELARRAASRARAEILTQREELLLRKRRQKKRQSEYALQHPDAYLDGRVKTRKNESRSFAPLLKVNLFGGLEVRIGDKLLDPSSFRRQKVKTLLALLVIKDGRDTSRDALIQALWPHAPSTSARNNFYTIWSNLRSALVLPDGSCPYLIRQQNVCRLEGSLLRSDIAAFDKLCRKLLFDVLDEQAWSEISSEIDGHFSNELLPGTTGVDAIDHLRTECRVRLGDALVAASHRLIREGRPREALWFARSALMRDQSREDAYAAVMEAQISAGQRAAALDTYFRCRRYLVDELGIDPSLKTIALYREIIESEEGLD